MHVERRADSRRARRRDDPDHEGDAGPAAIVVVLGERRHLSAAGLALDLDVRGLGLLDDVDSRAILALVLARESERLLEVRTGIASVDLPVVIEISEDVATVGQGHGGKRQEPCKDDEHEREATNQSGHPALIGA